MAHNKSVDGVSLTPLLRGDSIAERSIFWHYPHYHPGGATPYSAVRRGDWRLVKFYEGGSELYRLEVDLGENTQMAQRSPKVAAELANELEAWRSNVDAQVPTQKYENAPTQK